MLLSWQTWTYTLLSWQTRTDTFVVSKHECTLLSRQIPTQAPFCRQTQMYTVLLTNMTAVTLSTLHSTAKHEKTLCSIDKHECPHSSVDKHQCTLHSADKHEPLKPLAGLEPLKACHKVLLPLYQCSSSLLAHYNRPCQIKEKQNENNNKTFQANATGIALKKNQNCAQHSWTCSPKCIRVNNFHVPVKTYTAVPQNA